MIKLTAYVGRNWEAMVRLACREQVGVAEYDRRQPVSRPAYRWASWGVEGLVPGKAKIDRDQAIGRRVRPLLQDDDRLADDPDFRAQLRWDIEGRR